MKQRKNKWRGCILGRVCHFHRKQKPLLVVSCFFPAHPAGIETLHYGCGRRRVDTHPSRVVVPEGPASPRSMGPLDSWVCAVPQNLIGQGLGVEWGQQRHGSSAEEKNSREVAERDE